MYLIDGVSIMYYLAYFLAVTAIIGFAAETVTVAVDSNSSSANAFTVPSKELRLSGSISNI